MPARLNLGLQAMWIARVVLLRRPKFWTFGMSTFLLWNGLHLFDWMVLFCFFEVHPACVLYGVCIAEFYFLVDAVHFGQGPRICISPACLGHVPTRYWAACEIIEQPYHTQDYVLSVSISSWIFT